MRKHFILVLVAILLFIAAPFTTTQASASTGDDLISYAKKYTGTKYVYGGTTTSGFDCSGYTVHVFKEFGVSLKRTAAQQFTQGTSVSKSDLQKGDLVFFNNLGRGISHVGIYIGGGQMISATTSRGVAVDSIHGGYWGKYYAGAKRVLKQEPVKLPPVTNGQFVDVSSSHPAYEAIKTLNVDGIINGFDQQDFRPTAEVTRGQAAAMINRVLGLKASKPVSFSDVSPSHSFANDIAAMNEAGILQGYTNGKFGFNETLSKAQLAVILDRAFKTQEKANSIVQTAAIYNDVSPDHSAHSSIVALKAIDQTSVFQTSTFNGGANASRAEFSAALYSVLNVQ